jgi:hypothetical protein
MLDSRDLQFASYFEQEFMLRGDIPSKDRCREVLPFVTPQFYESRLRNKEFQEHLENLGVPIRRIIHNLPPGVLSIEQLRAINILLDFNDTRSDKKKLESLGIKTSTYQTWKKDIAFQDYIAKRALNLIGDNLDEVDRALLDQARSGELGAIKFIYEVTGRHDPKRDSQINLKEIIHLILEVIIQEVKDPETVKRIATKLNLIIAGKKLSDINKPENIIDTVAERESLAINSGSDAANF